MSRRALVIALIVIGAAIALLVGWWVTGDDDEAKPEAISALCGSLQSLDASVEALLGLDPSTATQEQYQSDVTAVEDAWDQVKTDAEDVESADTGDLGSAWDDFESTLKNVPDDSSVSDAVSDITESAQNLASTAESTASEIDCTSASA